MAGMVTMATVNIRPGVMKIQTPSPTSTTALVTTASTTSALVTTDSTTTATSTCPRVKSTTQVADLTYVTCEKSIKSLIVCHSEVLILLTGDVRNVPEVRNVPVLTNAAARDDRDLDFEIDEEAEVYMSCSLTWENELYVFGGQTKVTQILKVTSCRLELA